MKRFALIVCAALGLVLVTGSAVHADGCCGSCFSSLHYGGQQPWWNIFTKRNKYLTPEEERLQRFWHDYYDALKNYYCALDKIDWVAYYKNHGYQINTGCGYGAGPCGGCQRINYAPVFVAPAMQWAIPNNCMSQPPMGGCGPMGCGY